MTEAINFLGHILGIVLLSLLIVICVGFIGLFAKVFYAKMTEMKPESRAKAKKRGG